ncbi:phospholipid phosphatase 5-like [Saccoglossus kowalevskii]|uniref:Phosphatidate phosphatase PPAPDC1A-like n=1 Tax=Saccoglossus kowalevskii TaxID=10224 RepID=A0ABM0H1U2_SACKO|nr:PREDICTED: phosphatidate phosphatase PPAPDC1A-like [Saccoglossus kowalevskii]
MRIMVNHENVAFFNELVIRGILLIIFIVTDDMKPFFRVIQPEEMWLYKNPFVENDQAPFEIVLCIAIFLPLGVIAILFISQRKKNDAIQSFLALSLALCLNAVITNSVKLTVGRPRPDFFFRCFPDGHMTDNLECNGDEEVVIQGRKSFPSGHSSFSFTGLGFTAMYLAGKLHCFHPRGRGVAWRLCVPIIPLLVATFIAISRTQDYKHHWQDVLVGSILGLIIAYLSYRQYYPPLDSPQCDSPHIDIIETNTETTNKELQTVKYV